MSIKKVSAKHSRSTDRRRSQRMATKRGGPRSGISTRKARPGRRQAARRRMDEGVNSEAGNYRSTAAWL